MTSNILPHTFNHIIHKPSYIKHIQGWGTRWSLINKRFNNSGPARFKTKINPNMNYRANECRAEFTLAMPSAADSA